MSSICEKKVLAIASKVFIIPNIFNETLHPRKFFHGNIFNLLITVESLG